MTLLLLVLLLLLLSIPNLYPQVGDRVTPPRYGWHLGNRNTRGGQKLREETPKLNQKWKSIGETNHPKRVSISLPIPIGCKRRWSVPGILEGMGQTHENLMEQVSKLQRRIETSEAAIAKALEQIDKSTKAMQMKTTIQKNLSQDIKTGIK